MTLQRVRRLRVPGLVRCRYAKDHHEADGVHRVRCVLPFWHRWGNTIHLLSAPARRP